MYIFLRFKTLFCPNNFDLYFIDLVACLRYIQEIKISISHKMLEIIIQIIVFHDNIFFGFSPLDRFRLNINQPNILKLRLSASKKSLN